MSPSFDLILDGVRRGVDNMRIDEGLLAEARPAVRLYGWEPACVSLGRAQTQDEVDLEAASALGLDVVRRATGGGAILHDATEVTYAVVVPLDHPGHPRDIPGSFTYLSRGVQVALERLGLDVEVRSSGENTRETLCYLRHQGTNLFVGPRKISGGAQRRTSSAVLQHGTVIVTRDADAMARVFRSDADAIRRKVTSLVDEGVHVRREEVVRELVEGFRQALGAEFTPRAIKAVTD